MVSRRKMLTGLLAAPAMIAAGNIDFGGSQTEEMLVLLLDSFALRGDRRESAAVMGEQILANEHDSASGATIVANLQTLWLDYTGSGFPSGSDNCAKAWEGIVRDDFLHRRTRLLDGWLISQTEADFYVLAAKSFA